MRGEATLIKVQDVQGARAQEINHVCQGEGIDE
jgi:hypothetical protein